MRKQELFLLAVTGVIWLRALKGRPFIALLYYQLYAGLYLSRIFVDFQWLRLPFTTSIVAFVSLLLHKAKSLYLSKQAVLMAALFGVMCFSRFINNLPILGHEYMQFYYKLIFAHILITSLIDTREKLKSFTWVLIISSVTLSIVARYYDAFTAYFWMDKNAFAVDLLISVGFLMYLSISQRTVISQVEAITYLLFVLYALAGTNSRGAYIAVFIMVMLVVVDNFKSKRLLILLFPIFILGIRVSDVHLHRFHSIKTDITDFSGTAGQRISIWKTAVRMINSNPFFGVGTGEFPNNFERYSTPETIAKTGGGKTNTHNTILQMAAENGLAGIFLLLYVFAITFKDLLKCLRLCRGDPALQPLLPITKAILVSLLGFLIAGQFLNYAYHLHLYTLISLSVAVSRVVLNRATVTATTSESREAIFRVAPYPYQVALRCLVLVLCTYICLQL